MINQAVDYPGLLYLFFCFSLSFDDFINKSNLPPPQGGYESKGEVQLHV